MAKKIVKQLTLEQERQLFLRPCKTKKELKAWIKRFFALELPDQTVSRYADTNPLDLIWEIYEICVVRNNPNGIKELLCVAGRGSGKCVVKGTAITTINGPRNIENVMIGDVVWTGLNWKPVSHTFDEGVKAGIKITTRKGKKEGAFALTGSMRHRIQALNSATGKIDWVYMPDLRQGQLVYKTAEKVFDRLIDTKSDEYEKGWILGNVLGDGSVSRHDNSISLCGTDLQQLDHYRKILKKHFDASTKDKKDDRSKTLNVVTTNSLKYRRWFESLVDGELCYFKKLKTLEHSPNFLAGIVSGLMETDGSKDSITLANRVLIGQVAQILNLFGVHATVNNNRRRPATTKFVPGHKVTYHEVVFTQLSEYMMPLFSKRATFLEFKRKQNEQFRYPSVLVKSFANYIKNKYEIANGYWRLSPGNKTRSNVRYSKDLWGTGEKSKEAYVYGYKIDSFIELAEYLKEGEWANYLRFVRNGFYEEVATIEHDNYYFHDLEVADDHAYASNGFISHNTLAMAIVELLVMLHDQRDCVHVGAILSQADRCYTYQKSFLFNPRLKDIVMPKDLPEDRRILEKANMGKSIFNVSGEKVTMEVLPCTLKSVNGPHVAFVAVDEIDTVDGEGKKAFADISGMLDSKGGRQALRVGISTRKTRFGLMNSQIESIEKTPNKTRQLRKWTAFEFSERCGDDRSGTELIDLYVNQDKFEVLTPEEFNKKDPSKQKDFQLHRGYTGCAKCPLFPICLTDAKKQQSKSHMLKPLDDVISKVYSEGPDWALAQLMNLKPSLEGVIYKEFDEKLHVKSWNEMWFQLVGKEYPGECTHDIFVKKVHELKLPVYAGIDWGWSNPNTVVFFTADARENIYVIKVDAMTYVSEPAWIHHIKTKYHLKYRCQLYFPDVANQGAIQEMQKAGLPAANNDKGEINAGIQVVKKFLKAPGSNEPKLFIARDECRFMINEFTMYHFKTNAAGEVTEDPEGEYDHSLDALRYAMTQLFGKTNVILGGGLSFDNAEGLRDRNGAYSRVPTASEFAAVNGIRFQENEADTSKLGKIGKKSEIDPDDDDESGSGGGFLWSF